MNRPDGCRTIDPGTASAASVTAGPSNVASKIFNAVFYVLRGCIFRSASSFSQAAGSSSASSPEPPETSDARQMSKPPSTPHPHLSTPQPSCSSSDASPDQHDFPDGRLRAKHLAMLDDDLLGMLKDVMAEYAITPTGVIHVGAHEGQERDEYVDLGISNVVYMEAIPDVFERLKNNVSGYEGHLAISAVCSDVGGQEVTFNIANNEQSSSMMGLGALEKFLPEIFYENTLTLITSTVDDLLSSLNTSASLNVMIVDTQGAELKVLKGSQVALSKLDVLQLEVADLLQYEGGPTITALCDFLAPFNLLMKRLHINPRGWGDAVFVHSRWMVRPPEPPKVTGENLALAGMASASSVAPFDLNATAEKAINGNKTGRYSFCTEYEKEPWWELDLGKEAQINDILVFNRIDCERERTDGMRVLIGLNDERTLVFQHEGPSFGGKDGYPLYVPLGGVRGRYVRLELPKTAFFHLDEVEVYGRF